MNDIYSVNDIENSLDYDRKYPKLDKLIDCNILDKKHFKTYWVNGILSSIEEKMGEKIMDLTIGPIPNYGGMIRFTESSINSKSLVFEVQFYISFINNYISIQIAEIQEHRFFNPVLKREMISQNLESLTVSPTNNKYGEIFLKLEQVLSRIIHKPIFIPFSVGSTVIEGFSIPHSYKEVNTVDDAFFCKKVPIKQSNNVLGNINYRIEELT